MYAKTSRYLPCYVLSNRVTSFANFMPNNIRGNWGRGTSVIIYVQVLYVTSRSYELMERILKIYVYKEGAKPIFHQPILKGLYASEGWFMKLMERNKKYVVKDPRKAHLFYMPFSSRMLEYTLYVRNSHDRTNLRQYLKDYSEKIAAKYRFWNRTGGADHFLVACHDWVIFSIFIVFIITLFGVITLYINRLKNAALSFMVPLFIFHKY